MVKTNAKKTRKVNVLKTTDLLAQPAGIERSAFRLQMVDVIKVDFFLEGERSPPIQNVDAGRRSEPTAKLIEYLSLRETTQHRDGNNERGPVLGKPLGERNKGV